MSTMSREAQAVLQRYRAAQTLSAEDRARLLGAIQMRLAASALPAPKAGDPLRSGMHPTMAKLGALAPKVLALAIGVGAVGTGAALVTMRAQTVPSTASSLLPALTASARRLAPSATIGTPPATVTATASRDNGWTPVPVSTESLGGITPAAAPETAPAAAHRSAHPRRAESPRDDEPSPAAPATTAPEPTLAPMPEPAPTPTPAPAPHATPAASVDPVDEEVGLVGLAYTRLRDGDPEGAIAALDEHERRFPNGKLAESRRVTRVLALCQAGRVGEARRERDRFLAAYPHSPFTNRVRSACTESARGAP
jgi:hypothetical protein